MKNKYTILPALFILLSVALGCSFLDGVTGGGNSSNTATVTNSDANTADPNVAAKTGVAECDEFIDLLNQDRSNPEDNYLQRKGKELVIDGIKDQIKRNIEENQRDKQRIATFCKEARTEYTRNRDASNQN